MGGGGQDLFMEVVINIRLVRLLLLEFHLNKNKKGILRKDGKRLVQSMKLHVLDALNKNNLEQECRVGYTPSNLCTTFDVFPFHL